MAVTIQRVRDDVYGLYNKMKTSGRPMPLKEDSQMTISTATKMKPAGVVASLESFKKLCKSEALKEAVATTIAGLLELEPDGTQKLFKNHDFKSGVGHGLEFLCLAVKKYVSDRGVIVCDFALATYSYSTGIDGALIATGAVTGLTTAGLMALAIFGFVTGGAGFVALGVGSAVAALGTGAGTSAAVYHGVKCNAKTEPTDVLEACFIYELVERGYAIVNEKQQLRLTVED